MSERKWLPFYILYGDKNEEWVGERAREKKKEASRKCNIILNLVQLLFITCLGYLLYGVEREGWK